MLAVLHLSPHPDDEAMGAGATLLALREAGHRVINLACGLGRPEQYERRRAEVTDACERAGWELIVHDPPLHMSRGDDLTSVRVAVSRAAARIVAEEGISLLVSPAPEDAHPAHATVARAAQEAAQLCGIRWWAWGLWRDLEAPTLYYGFGEERLAELQRVLHAHRGELARNDFPALLRARAVAARVLGAERVWGFGSPGREDAYAELLTEWIPDGKRLVPGAPRALDPAVPFGAFDQEAPGS